MCILKFEKINWNLQNKKMYSVRNTRFSTCNVRKMSISKRVIYVKFSPKTAVVEADTPKEIKTDVECVQHEVVIPNMLLSFDDEMVDDDASEHTDSVGCDSGGCDCE
jgi:hypothetical protein